MRNQLKQIGDQNKTGSRESAHRGWPGRHSMRRKEERLGEEKGGGSRSPAGEEGNEAPLGRSRIGAAKGGDGDGDGGGGDGRRPSSCRRRCSSLSSPASMIVANDSRRSLL